MSPPRCRVSFGEGHSSGWLQWYTLSTSERTDWSAPSVGDPVTVMSEGGDERNGVVLLGLLVDSRQPPSSSPTEHVTSYVDGATQTYDTATHELTWKGVEGGSVKIIGEAKIEIIGKESIAATSDSGAISIAGKTSVAVTSDAGPIDITGKTSVTVTSEGFVTITGPEKVTINGPGGIFLNGPTTVSETLKVIGIGTFMSDLNVSGNITDKWGSMQSIRVIYNGHNHKYPDGNTDIPNQLMALKKARKKSR